MSKSESNKKRNVDESISKKKIKDKTDNIAYKINSSKIGEVLSRLCGILVALILAMIILFILVKGLPTLISKPQLIYGKFEFGSKSITILPSIICTVILVIISMLIATPVGRSIIATVKEPDIIDDEPPSTLTKVINPKSPYTMDGTPPRIFMAVLTV